MRDKLLRALGPTGRTRGAANARSKIIIMHNLLLRVCYLELLN